MGSSDDLLNKLLETFQGEAEDHLRAISALLLELEKEAGGMEEKRLVETLYRKMHTLKGAAQAVNLTDIGDICQSLESVLAALKRGEAECGTELFDRLHETVDSLGRLIFPAAAPDAEAEKARLAEVVKAMEQTLAGGIARPPARKTATKGAVPVAKVEEIPRPEEAEPPKERESHPAAVDTTRVATRLLDSLLLQAEEFLSAKLTAAELAEELAGVMAVLAAQKNGRGRIKALVQALRKQTVSSVEATRLAELLEAGDDLQVSLEQRLKALERSAEHHCRTLGGMVENHLEEMKKVHMLPFASLLEPFRKVTRDICRNLGKEAEFTYAGGELEIDRRILGELKEPLLHIVRNMVDHGIEKPAERLRRNKPATGRISVAVAHRDGNRAELVVTDDGGGIDVAKVRASAMKLGLIGAAEADNVPDREVIPSIFESGVSASPMITAVSGRGLGLPIVRESMERIGGHVSVTTEPGRGTEFRLLIPLSFATFQGLLVEAHGRPFIIPAAHVEKTGRVPYPEIRTVENRETISQDGLALALARLGEVLELAGAPPDETPAGSLPVVILALADQRIALAVDQLLGIQEVLVKPLGRQLARVRNVAGATVLGNGSVVPILNAHDLLKSAIKGATAPRPGAIPTAEPAGRRVTVLVAEDSITSRTLLKNILEASGFRVRTAVDGLDALNLLRSEEFDIVVSDVEMPRLDGFELTAAIRGDKKLAGLPVILVTGLESREDRERGIDVGANAYIVKSSFDQSSLIEVIGKLT
jgi:two-component system, chemotaxis family, sensor kinase CheA